MVQLRAKQASDRQTLDWARAIRKLTSAVGVRFVLNDRFDLALAAGADAVHLGQSDLPPDSLPAEDRKRLAVGRSTHDSTQARAARSEAVDYVAFGPVFGTTSKASAYPERGLEALREIVAIVAPLPLVAIGGIDAPRIASVFEAGASGAAVISAVAAAPDPEAAVRDLISRMEQP